VPCCVSLLAGPAVGLVAPGGTRARGTIPFSITWETPKFGTNFALPRHSSAPSYPGLPPYVADNEALARHRASAEPEGRRHRQRSQKGTGRL